MMAGRNISVTHVALGTVRVMRTTGMMGEVVGMAASLCTKHAATPRGVYEKHLDELKALMQRGVGKPDFAAMIQPVPLTAKFSDPDYQGLAHSSSMLNACGDDRLDVDHVLLPAVAAVRRVDDHQLAVAADAGMRVATPLAPYSSGDANRPSNTNRPLGTWNRYRICSRFAPCGYLSVTSHWLFVPGMIGLVAVGGGPQRFLGLARAVVLVQAVAALGPDQHVLRIAPRPMRRPAGREQPQVAAVGADGEDARRLAAGADPTMEHQDPFSVRTPRQVVDVVLVVGLRVLVGDLDEVRHGDEHPRLARLQVHPPHADLGRGRLVGIRVGNARVAVARADIPDAAEVAARRRAFRPG